MTVENGRKAHPVSCTGRPDHPQQRQSLCMVGPGIGVWFVNKWDLNNKQVIPKWTSEKLIHNSWIVPHVVPLVGWGRNKGNLNWQTKGKIKGTLWINSEKKNEFGGKKLRSLTSRHHHRTLGDRVAIKNRTWTLTSASLKRWSSLSRVGSAANRTLVTVGRSSVGWYWSTIACTCVDDD